jgi:hypothetical protein
MTGTTAPTFTSLRELVLYYATRQGLSTQRRLAIACDLDETAVSRFLNGEQDIGAWTTYCLFQAAGVPVDQYHRAFALLGEAQEIARNAREARARRRIKLVQQSRVAMAFVALALGVGGAAWVAQLQLRSPASPRQAMVETPTVPTPANALTGESGLVQNISVVVRWTGAVGPDRPTATPVPTIPGDISPTPPPGPTAGPRAGALEICFNLQPRTQPQPITVIVTRGSVPATSTDHTNQVIGRVGVVRNVDSKKCTVVELSSDFYGFYGGEYTIAIFEGKMLIATSTRSADPP